MRTAVAVVVLALGVGAGCAEVRIPTQERPVDTERPSPGSGEGGGTGQGGGEGYSFMHTREDGEPVRWSTCEPIEYVVREQGEPDGGRELLDQAVDRISEATGLELSFAGVTDEAPARQRQPYHPDRYGEQWSPVLVAWSGPDEFSRLEGRAAGFGGPVVVRREGTAPRYVSGTVVLDAEQLQGMGEDSIRAVIVHELAHVVGLAHVDDRGQLMNPVQYGRRVTELQPGDVAGLEELGSGNCYEPIDPRGFGG